MNTLLIFDLFDIGEIMLHDLPAECIARLREHVRLKHPGADPESGRVCGSNVVFDLRPLPLAHPPVIPDETNNP